MYAALLMLGGESAAQQPSAYWFHHPTIDAATARVDIEYCLAQIASIEGGARRRMGFSPTGLVLNAILDGAEAAGEARRMQAAALRKCMAIYGYARVPAAPGVIEAAQASADPSAALARLATGSRPIGAVLPP